MARAGCQTHRHASREILQNMIISYITHISYESQFWPYHITCSCKNKLDASPLLFAILRGFQGLQENQSYPTQSHKTLINKLLINHQPAVAQMVSTKVRATDTREPHMQYKLHVKRGTGLSTRTIKVVRAAASHNTAKTKEAKQGSNKKINAHKIVFYSYKATTQSTALIPLQENAEQKTKKILSCGSKTQDLI